MTEAETGNIQKIRKRHWLLWLTLLITLVLLLVIGLWQSRYAAPLTIKLINHYAGDYGHISLGKISGSLFNRLSISGLTWQGRDSIRVTIGDIRLQYRLWPLVHERLEIDRVQISHLNLYLPLAKSEPDEPSAEWHWRQLSSDSLRRMLDISAIVDTIFATLPQLRLSNFNLEIDTLRLNNSFLLTEGRLGFDLQTGADSAGLVLHRLTFHLPDYDFRLQEADGQIRLSREKFRLNDLRFNADGLATKIDADWHFSTKDSSWLEAGLEIPDFRRFRKIQNDSLPGSLAAGLQLRSFPAGYSLQLQANGQAGNYPPVAVELLVESFAEELKVDRFLIKSDSATVQGYLEMNLSDGRLQSNLKSRAFNLKALDPALPETIINLDLLADVKTVDQPETAGQINLMVFNSELDGYPLDSLVLRLQGKNRNWMLLDHSMVQITPQLIFDLSGDVHRLRQANLNLSARRAELSALSQILETEGLQGEFFGHISVLGDLYNPQLAASLTIPLLTYPGLVLENVQADLDLSGLAGNRQGHGNFNILSGTVYDQKLNDIRLEASISGDSIFIPLIQLYNEQNFIRSSLRIALGRSVSDITVDKLRTEYGKYWLELGQPWFWEISAQSLQTSTARFWATDSGRVEFETAYHFDSGLLTGQGWFGNLQLEPVNQFTGPDLSLKGVANGSGSFLYSPDSLISDAVFNISGLEINKVFLGELNGEGQYSNGRINLRRLSLNDGESEFSARGDVAFVLNPPGGRAFDVLEDTQANLDVLWENINLDKFARLAGVKKLTGRTSGYIEADGQINNPLIRHLVTLDDFRFEEYRLDSLHLNGQYNNGYMIIDSLSAIFNDTHFSASGWQRYDLRLSQMDTAFLDKPFFLHLLSRDDQIGFLGNFNEQLEAIEGKYTADLFLAGTPNHPALVSGYIRMDDGKILLSRIQDPLTKARVDVTIEDSVLQIRNFTVSSREKQDWLETAWQRISRILFFWRQDKAGKGQLAASGRIGLQDLLRPDMDLTVEMEEFFIDYFIENTRLVLTDRNLTIRGQDTLVIRGNMYVSEGQYELDPALMDKNIYLTTTTAEPVPPFIDLSLGLQMPGNFVITSSPLDLANNFKVIIKGDLQVVMMAGSDEVQIQGALEVASGKYASWNQNFEVGHGTITFSDPTEINPDIDITASKKIQERVFQLQITGNLEKMNQNIRVLANNQEIAMSFQDKIALLTLGADISGLQSNAGSTLRNVGEEVATTSVLTAVERGAEQLTGLDKVEISANEKILDLQKVRLNNGLREASLSIGKYLTNDLYVEYKTQFGGNIPAPRLGWQSGNRLGLEYRINPQWRLDSNYEKTIQGNNKVQIGISWEYSF